MSTKFTIEDLLGWPEPVVPVQSLSTSGLASIPERYVKPPADRPLAAALPTAGREGGLSIPVVDMSGLFDLSADRRQATVAAMADACKEWGFFQVVNHGVSRDLVERLRGGWRAFFQLPMGQKKSYANSPKTYEGYGSRLGVEKDARLDWCDYFFLHVLPENSRSPHKWPSEPQKLRGIIEEFSREVVAKVCETLMKALSMGLGLEEGYLQKAFGGDGAEACMRVNLYPKCPQPELTLGLSAHSDPGILTVLVPDDRVPGLQVRKGGAWVAVQTVPGAFVVNVGDQTQVISNGMYKSVEHRVAVNSSEDRLSLVIFYNPDGNIPIGPAQELLIRDSPPLYHPLTFNEYRKYVRTKGPRGKSQVESLKAALPPAGDRRRR